jgi:hypothetical protein
MKGLPYGGAAPVQKPTPSKPLPKKQTMVGFVAAVQDTPILPSDNVEIHNEPWVGDLICQKIKSKNSVRCSNVSNVIPTTILYHPVHS